MTEVTGAEIRGRENIEAMLRVGEDTPASET
jgi:hypothetical protein